MSSNIQQEYFDLKMLVRQLRILEKDGPNSTETSKEWSDKRKHFQALVDGVIFVKEKKNNDN